MWKASCEKRSGSRILSLFCFRFSSLSPLSERFCWRVEAFALAAGGVRNSQTAVGCLYRFCAVRGHDAIFFSPFREKERFSVESILSLFCFRVAVFCAERFCWRVEAFALAAGGVRTSQTAVVAYRFDGMRFVDTCDFFLLFERKGAILCAKHLASFLFPHRCLVVERFCWRVEAFALAAGCSESAIPKPQ